MIKGKGKLRKLGGVLQDAELQRDLEKLSDNGEYLYLIVDDKKNRNTPGLTYLFSVVLKCVSDQLPDHPPTMGLYRYFEEIFAPLHTCIINGEKYEYCDLKSERVVDVDNFIERVVKYSKDKWGIEIPEKGLLKDPLNRELYSQAYFQQEVDWNSFISSKNKH